MFVNQQNSTLSLQNVIICKACQSQRLLECNINSILYTTDFWCRDSSMIARQSINMPLRHFHAILLCKNTGNMFRKNLIQNSAVEILVYTKTSSTILFVLISNYACKLQQYTCGTWQYSPHTLVYHNNTEITNEIFSQSLSSVFSNCCIHHFCFTFL